MIHNVTSHLTIHYVGSHLMIHQIALTSARMTISAGSQASWDACDHPSLHTEFPSLPLVSPAIFRRFAAPPVRVARSDLPSAGRSIFDHPLPVADDSKSGLSSAFHVSDETVNEPASGCRALPVDLASEAMLRKSRGTALTLCWSVAASIITIAEQTTQTRQSERSSLRLSFCQRVIMMLSGGEFGHTSTPIPFWVEDSSDDRVLCRFTGSFLGPAIQPGNFESELLASSSTRSAVLYCLLLVSTSTTSSTKNFLK